LCPVRGSIYGSVRNIEQGVKRLAQNIMGASHLAQTIVPALLDPSSQRVEEWKMAIRDILGTQARYVSEKLSLCPGLSVAEPAGAMYALVSIDPSRFENMIRSDIEFTERLLEEENVFVLPGKCFGATNSFRIVFCAPSEVLENATNRIHDFCRRHAIP
jgi:tyrosine aminotransferase